MILTIENKEEAIKVLRFLEVDEEAIEFLECTREGIWTHKFRGWLGGRDGWSGLFIDRGPDYDLDPEYDEHIIVDGVDYLISESD